MKRMFSRTKGMRNERLMERKEGIMKAERGNHAVASNVVVVVER